MDRQLFSLHEHYAVANEKGLRICGDGMAAIFTDKNLALRYGRFNRCEVVPCLILELNTSAEASDPPKWRGHTIIEEIVGDLERHLMVIFKSFDKGLLNGSSWNRSKRDFLLAMEMAMARTVEILKSVINPPHEREGGGA